VFAKDKPEHCAARLDQLLTDPEIYRTIRTNARPSVDPRFRLSRMVTDIERALLAEPA
jgi:hypothetical protein